MPALDRSSPILDSAVTVSFDIHDSAEWVYRSIGSDCTWLHHAPACGHANDLAIAFVHSAGEYRLIEPVPLPTAAFAALAIAGYS